MMNRRELFGLLAAGLTLDPERLLWKPGKLISIPKGRIKPFKLPLVAMRGGDFRITEDAMKALASDNHIAIIGSSGFRIPVGR